MSFLHFSSIHSLQIKSTLVSAISPFTHLHIISLLPSLNPVTKISITLIIYRITCPPRSFPYYGGTPLSDNKEGTEAKLKNKDYHPRPTLVLASSCLLSSANRMPLKEAETAINPRAYLIAGFPPKPLVIQ